MVEVASSFNFTQGERALVRVEKPYSGQNTFVLHAEADCSWRASTDLCRCHVAPPPATLLSPLLPPALSYCPRSSPHSPLDLLSSWNNHGCTRGRFLLCAWSLAGSLNLAASRLAPSESASGTFSRSPPIPILIDFKHGRPPPPRHGHGHWQWALNSALGAGTTSCWMFVVR